MDLKKLSIADKKVFDKFLRLSTHELSAYSFANIYVWKGLFEIEWSIINDCLCVFFKDRIGCFLYLPPIGEALTKDTIFEAFKIMDDFNENQSVSRIENVEAVSSDFFKSIGFDYRAKDSEYLCRRKDLVKLAGDKFKSKRAVYNYFIKNYKPEYKEFNIKMKDTCLNLYKDWSSERRKKYKDPIYLGMLDDGFSVQRCALENFEKLPIIGRVVRIENKIMAYSLGYKLNTSTFCILSEVADLKIKGLPQYIFREFCRELEGFDFINIMDDSGLLNLRNVKLSFHPYKQIPNFIVTKSMAPKN